MKGDFNKKWKKFLVEMMFEFGGSGSNFSIPSSSMSNGAVSGGGVGGNQGSPKMFWPVEIINAFNKTMQQNYNDLFKGSKIIPVNLLKTVKNKIVNSSELSKGCHII